MNSRSVLRSGARVVMAQKLALMRAPGRPLRDLNQVKEFDEQ